MLFGQLSTFISLKHLLGVVVFSIQIIFFKKNYNAMFNEG